MFVKRNQVYIESLCIECHFLKVQFDDNKSKIQRKWTLLESLSTLNTLVQSRYSDLKTCYLTIGFNNAEIQDWSNNNKAVAFKRYKRRSKKSIVNLKVKYIKNTYSQVKIV